MSANPNTTHLTPDVAISQRIVEILRHRELDAQTLLSYLPGPFHQARRVMWRMEAEGIIVIDEQRRVSLPRKEASA